VCVSASVNHGLRAVQRQGRRPRRGRGVGRDNGGPQQRRAGAGRSDLAPQLAARSGRGVDVDIGPAAEDRIDRVLEGRESAGGDESAVVRVRVSGLENATVERSKMEGPPTPGAPTWMCADVAAGMPLKVSVITRRSARRWLDRQSAAVHGHDRTHDLRPGQLRRVQLRPAELPPELAVWGCRGC